MFTPAIRAKDFSPVADLRTGHVYLFRAGVRKREHDALPLDNPGPGIVDNYPTWIRALLKDSIWFRQPSLCFSSPFRDLLRGFLGPPRDPGAGTCHPLEVAFTALRTPWSPFLEAFAP